MTMSTSDGAAKARAEALFRRPTDDKSDTKLGVNAEAEKTAKLRALRLAKEESDRIVTEVRRVRREQRRP